MKQLKVDFSQSLGPIKAVNGVNNGPLTCNFSQDARPYFKEARIPFSRLHDTEYPFGSGEFVDVSCLFKNFNCDENDPANYNFTLTDEYLKAIDECGTKIIYRLGATIEHQPVKVHAVPPTDYLKWAHVCEHIIRHYNEGWANGLHLGIEYWEIWNEPELGGHQCWTGTPEEYCRFYITVVTHLKEKFPHLKFGGPACCSVYGDFAVQFLEALTADGRRAPLDFFSWHGYMRDPREGARAARHLDALLKEYGYEQTESIYDEWNYVRDWSKVDESFRIIADERGAAFDAGMMCALQSSPCDIAAYYDAQTKFTGRWCGLFGNSLETRHGFAGVVQVKKPYYAFKAFGELARLGTQAPAEIEEGNVFACAAKGEDGEAVLLANFREDDCKVERVRVHFEGGHERYAVYKLDKAHNLEKCGEITDGELLTMSRYSVVLLMSE